MSPPVVERDHNDKKLWDLHDLCVTDPYEVAWYLNEHNITIDDIVYNVGDDRLPPKIEYPCHECGQIHPHQSCLEFYHG